MSRRYDAVDPWHAIYKRDTLAARASREAHPLHAECVAEAAARGYELAPTSMLGEGLNFAADLYTYRGEIFVKKGGS